MGNPNTFIRFHFGELRIIGLVTLQTNLLLIRAVGEDSWFITTKAGANNRSRWLDKLGSSARFFGLNDGSSFLTVPESVAGQVLAQLLADIHRIMEGINSNSTQLSDNAPPNTETLRKAVNSVLAAGSAKDLVQALDDVANIAHALTEFIIDNADRPSTGERGLVNKIREHWGDDSKRDELAGDFVALLGREQKSSERILALVRKGADADKEMREMIESFMCMAGVLRIAKSDQAPSKFIVSYPSTGELELSWHVPEGKSEKFLSALARVAGEYRNDNHESSKSQNDQGYCPSHIAHTPHDRLAFHAGYYLLSQGWNLFDSCSSRTIGTVGFRSHSQTYLSLTDPGQGHVFGTTLRKEFMKGAIVHVEHLERPAGTTQAQIESYRIPSIREFARVRLHTGNEAPNTCYVGRPPHDSGVFADDFIKVVDIVSSACSSLFLLGAAECKVAMGDLKATSMVAFMRALKGHTMKNYRQCLSAAFNLNTPLVDDIENRYIKNPEEIAQRGIELAALGGFDKVTFDGASDTYPSTPLLKESQQEDAPGLLSLPVALKLVHQAHSAGLVTYFSAGFKVKHIEPAVFSGVDGIGLGGAQVLRSMDATSGMHGEYQAFLIPGLISKRDHAARLSRGQAALLLARLDQMYYEGSISKDTLALRTQLFKLLSNAKYDSKPEGLEELLEKGAPILKLPDDFGETAEEPWRARAERLLKAEDPLLQEFNVAEDWLTFKGALEAVLNDRAQQNTSDTAPVQGTGDAQGVENTTKDSKESDPPSIDGRIHSLYMTPQWQNLLKKYHEDLENAEDDPKPRFFAGEINASLKCAPFGTQNSVVVSDLRKKGAHEVHHAQIAKTDIEKFLKSK